MGLGASQGVNSASLASREGYDRSEDALKDNAQILLELKTPEIKEEDEEAAIAKEKQDSVEKGPETPGRVRGLSFVGYFEDITGRTLSHDRVYSSTGESLNMTRSIGDKTAARSVIGTPSIRDYFFKEHCSARIVFASDGVWEVFR